MVCIEDAIEIRSIRKFMELICNVNRLPPNPDAASGSFESTHAMHELNKVVLQIAACNSSTLVLTLCVWITFDSITLMYEVWLYVGTNGLQFHEGHLLNRWICLEEIIAMTYWNSSFFFVGRLWENCVNQMATSFRAKSQTQKREENCWYRPRKRMWKTINGKLNVTLKIAQQE